MASSGLPSESKELPLLIQKSSVEASFFGSSTSRPGRERWIRSSSPRNSSKLPYLFEGSGVKQRSTIDCKGPPTAGTRPFICCLKTSPKYLSISSSRGTWKGGRG